MQQVSPGVSPPYLQLHLVSTPRTTGNHCNEAECCHEDGSAGQDEEQVTEGCKETQREHAASRQLIP